MPRPGRPARGACPRCPLSNAACGETKRQRLGAAAKWMPAEAQLQLATAYAGCVTGAAGSAVELSLDWTAEGGRPHRIEVRPLRDVSAGVRLSGLVPVS